MYPLRFQGLLRRYIWGGRRLETVLGKPLGPGGDYAESWEIADHGKDQSVVSQGPLAGRSLGSLVAEHGRELLGRHHPQKSFPLLFKFLDANHNLSVQVHPNDSQAAKLDPPDLGKTEAWVVMHSLPGSTVYAGLQQGVDQAAFRQAVQAGETVSCLHPIQPRAGDCIFVPAGTVHAIGAGLLVAEIQQASDTTFRIYDWDRVDGNGEPRPLHIEQAIQVIDFERGPVHVQQPERRADSEMETLVSCDKFVLRRRSLRSPTASADDDQFHLLVVLQGVLSVVGDLTSKPMGPGDVCLVPAACADAELRPLQPCTVLDISLE